MSHPSPFRAGGSRHAPGSSAKTPRTGPEDPAYGARGYQFRWMVMTVVILADVMDLLDATIANLAGPSIRRDIGGDESTLQWILAAYTLTFAVGLITSARLGDLVGRRSELLRRTLGELISILSLCWPGGCGASWPIRIIWRARC